MSPWELPPSALSCTRQFGPSARASWRLPALVALAVLAAGAYPARADDTRPSPTREDRVLRGLVVLLDERNQETEARAGVEVTLVGYDTAVTNRRGEFRFRLNDRLLPGHPMRLAVKYPGWRIVEPNARIPDDLSVAFVVQLVPVRPLRSKGGGKKKPAQVEGQKAPVDAPSAPVREAPPPAIPAGGTPDVPVPTQDEPAQARHHSLPGDDDVQPQIQPLPPLIPPVPAPTVPTAVVSKPPASPPLAVPPQPSNRSALFSRASAKVAVATGGVALVALGAGVLGQVRWQKRVGAFNDRMDCDGDFDHHGGPGCQQLFDEGQTAKKLMYVGYGVAGAFSVVTGILLWSVGHQEEPRRMACAASIFSLRCGLHF